MREGPNSTYTQHALRELLLQSRATSPGAEDEEMLVGPRYHPLQIENIMETNARKEGTRTVTERHLTMFIKGVWSPCCRAG
jgi:hypothetical protein